MFDDTQPKSGTIQTPPNLPLGEPEDMFAPTSAAGVSSSSGVSDAGGADDLPASALSSGLLRPKGRPTSSSPAMSSPPSMDDASAKGGAMFQTPPPVTPSGTPDTNAYKMKEPILSRVLITIVLVLVVGGALFGGGWWIYRRFIAPPANTIPFAEKTDVPSQNGTDVSLPPPAESGAPGEVVSAPPAGGTAPSSSDIVSDIIDDKVLFGGVVDSDADGLDDVRENDIGTNPKNWDTDADELSDYNEVAVWKTDPFRADTDGDGYVDGQEVKHGYSPTGPGKLFEPPTSTASST